METLPTRLRYYRRRHGWTLEQVGRLCGGKSRASIGVWESQKKAGSPSVEDLKRLAREYGISVDELVGADGVARAREGRVPLISFEQVAMQDVSDLMHVAGFAEQLIPCPVEHSVQTYALRVSDLAMCAPSGPTYPPGRIIFCDMGQAGAARSGERVIAVLESGVAVFRELVDDGVSGPWLRPLNPQWPRIDDSFRIVAKVVGSFVPE